MNSLSEPRYDIQKRVNVYRANQETKKYFLKMSFTIHEEKFSLFHVKIDVKISVSPKNNVWKEISVSFSEPKKALLSENVIRLQSQTERCL